MLKILIKKQFQQCFRGYFINSKTGKAKSKTSIIGTFVLFGFIMLLLSSSFFGFATTVSPLLDAENRWLYYSLFGLMAIGLGTFTTAFNASSYLYNSKDNDLLLSMPIKPGKILISRIALLYGLALLYSSVVWLPICLYAFIYDGFSIIACIYDLVLLFFICVFICVISCLLGYIIADITRRVKNKSVITVIISLAFLSIYYLLCFRLESIIDSIVMNSNKIANSISTWGYFIYQLGKGASGDLRGFIIFVFINCVLGFVCYVILKKSYTKIITGSKNVQKTNGKIKYNSHSNINKALLSKEAKRFVSSPTYLLNCGLSSVFVLVAGIATLIKQSNLEEIYNMIGIDFPSVNDFIPLLIISIITLITSIGILAVPSISLEKNNLWIIKSLPIETYKILEAKKLLQLLVNGIPGIISGTIMCYAFKIDFSVTICVLLVIYLFMETQACINSLLSLVNPNFTWTSEAQPIKQSMMNLLAMISSLIISVLIVVPYYFLRDNLDINNYLQYVYIIMMVIIILLRKLMRTWGVDRFNAL